MISKLMYVATYIPNISTYTTITIEVKINFQFKKGVGIATKSKETSN